MPVSEKITSTTGLVHAARNGDSRAVEQLVRRYARVVWSTVRSYRLREVDANDAVQNTWLRMIESLDTVRDPERLPGWLATAARRECLKIIQSGRRETVATDPGVFERADDLSPNPERYATDQAMNALLWDQVAQLPRPGRHMIATLTAANAPSYQDFARTNGLPIGSIGPMRMRYLRQLRQRLEQSGLGAQAWRDG
jgi:RNA polymerase sigma factor (sigma-70 family)